MNRSSYRDEYKEAATPSILMILTVQHYSIRVRLTLTLSIRIYVAI